MSGRVTSWSAGFLAAALLGGGCQSERPPPQPPPRDRRLGAQRCTGLPGPRNPLNPVLQRPFDGQYPVLSLFDHELPSSGAVGLAAAGDSELTYCGVTALGVPEGVAGYAFALPLHTPVLAPADGEVVSAGVRSPFACPVTRRPADDELSIELRHDGLGGVGFITRYTHLARVLVQEGARVVRGQRIGLSGESGCATGPQLYFEVKRLTATRTGEPVVVDPYGWDGPGPDPWAEAAAGAPSQYLWFAHEAPTLKAR